MEISFVNDEYSTSIDAAVEFANKNNLKYIELRNINSQNITDINDMETYTISSKIAQSGILVSSIASPFLFWHQQENNFSINGHKTTSEEDYFNYLMDLADIFGAPNISIYSYLKSNDMDISNLGEIFDKYSQTALTRGINLTLNIDDNCNIANINQMHKLFENYNFSNIHPLINTGKIIAQSADCSPEKLQDLSNICDYFHLSDYDTQLQRNVVLGEGNVDFASILHQKLNDNYTFASLAPATTHPEDLKMSLNILEDWLISLEDE